MDRIKMDRNKMQTTGIEWNGIKVGMLGRNKKTDQNLVGRNNRLDQNWSKYARSN
jgi:hypothetical protein